MNQIEQAIKELKSYDLSVTSDEEIKNKIGELGIIAMMVVTLHPEQYIIRGRPDPVYTIRKKEDEISYIKDPKIIPKYNRANLHGNAMFYGSITSQDERYAQIMTIYEITSLLDKSLEDGKEYEEYITMGKWEIIRDINLAVIAYHEDFGKDNVKLQNLKEDYLKFISEKPEKKEDFLKIAEFLSKEFSKPVNKEERFNYKISAAYSQLTVLLGLDGVMYPTTKDDGKGFNVAITPTAVDTKMKFKKAIVWRLQKKNNEIFIAPFLYSDKMNPKGEFVWGDPGIWIPESIVNNILNPKKE